MSSFKEITNNHSNEEVPQSETVSAFRITQIIIGIAITLPAFLVGAELMHALGFIRGVSAISIAGLTLTIIASVTMLAGARSRLSTYKLIQTGFGKTGAKVVNLLLSLTFLGWFGVTIQLFGVACQQTFSTVIGSMPSMSLLIVLGSILMVLTTVFGFRAIDTLARFAVPLLLLLLIAGIYRILSGYPLSELFMLKGDENTKITSMGMGISTAISGFMLAVTILPDITRFTRNKRDCPKAALFSFGLGYPLVLILAGIPVLVTGDKDLVATFIHINLGVPALLVVIFATWTTNISNLYSCSLALAQIFPRIHDWLLTAVAGLIGAMFALMGIMSHFIDFLLILGIAIPPVAGIYLTEYFLSEKVTGRSGNNGREKEIRPGAITAWLSGVAIAFLSTYEFISISSVPAIDGILAASLTYFFIQYIFRDIQKNLENESNPGT